MAYREDKERTLDQLTDQEVLALIALAREIVALDGRLPDAEREALDDLASEIGSERYDALLERSETLAGTDEELEQLVAEVVKVDAREAIYAALFDLASACSMDAAELDVLDWLAEAWELEVADPDVDDDEDDGQVPDDDDDDEVDDEDDDEDDGHER